MLFYFVFTKSDSKNTLLQLVTHGGSRPRFYESRCRKIADNLTGPREIEIYGDKTDSLRFTSEKFFFRGKGFEFIT